MLDPSDGARHFFIASLQVRCQVFDQPELALSLPVIMSDVSTMSVCGACSLWLLAEPDLLGFSLLLDASSFVGIPAGKSLGSPLALGGSVATWTAVA